MTYESAVISNLGNGQFALESSVTIPNRNSFSEPPTEFIDFDHDSDLDIIGFDVNLVAIPQNGPHDPCAGNFAPADAGCPGSGGFTPHLTALGCPSAGETVKLAMSQGLGGSVALLVFGAQPAAIPIGGTIPAGAGTVSVVTQYFTVDPGVALGYAGSNAVQINQQ